MKFEDEILEKINYKEIKDLKESIEKKDNKKISLKENIINKTK